MSSWRRRHSDEQGIALITALLAVLVIGGLVLVFVSRSITETRASASARDFETAVHAAEAASDTQVRELNRDEVHYTVDNAEPSGAPIELPSTMGDERAFVLDQLDRMRGSDAWLANERGEAYAFRPIANGTTSDPEPVDVIYAAAALPNFGHERQRLRVLKLQVAQDTYRPDFAIMTEGALDFGGNASVVVPGCDTSTPEEAEKTCTADIHTNSTFTNQGNAHTIQGRVSIADGSCAEGINAVACDDDGVATQPIPPFTARDFYRPDAELNQDPDGESMDWFDLCDDGKVREGDPLFGPCSSDAPVVWPENGDTSTSFRGWEYKSSQDEWQATSVGAGVFYVYGADADITGSAGDTQRSVTVIVEEDPANPTRTGSLAIAGNPDVQAGMDDVLFITDRDLRLRGTASGGTGDACGAAADTYAGFMGVGEQATVRSDIDLRGALVVQDKADEHGLVKRNTDGISGNMCLQYEQDLVVDLTGHWVITYWNEL